MSMIQKIYANILKKFLTSNNNTLSDYSTFFLEVLKGESVQKNPHDIYAFLQAAALEMRRELEALSPSQQDALQEVSRALDEKSFEEVFQSDDKYRALLWSVLSSEASGIVAQHPKGILAHAEDIIKELREQRTVDIVSHNPNPLQNPATQILFTSNILLTVPFVDGTQSEVPAHIMEKAMDIAKNEKQLYWYDHPMPIGITPEANEMLYGLHGLADMLAYEKEQGHVPQDSTIQVVLSVSVTHAGLSDIAQEYLQYELNRAGNFSGLDIYIITENDTKEISALLSKVDGKDDIATVFGVDGRYGRHYSFLKAILPLWNISMNGDVRATFKIDLDQIFPQDVLQKEAGKSALEQFKTALWGAMAKDKDGHDIELGMIAGALVNEADIVKGLFTPDVALPQEPLGTMDIMFPRGVMMALSTRAEMMTKYGSMRATFEGTVKGTEHMDGVQQALQRVHVTGGTNGILLDALKRYRPFTPSFIGRAEDQAYLMSVYNNNGTKLRYVHAAGLIMRHDKAAFAGDAIKAAKQGTYVGDLLRTILFSHYASVLPGGLEAFKHLFAPFTSCFSTDTPILAAVSRLLLHCAEMDESLQETQMQIAADGLLHEIDGVKCKQNVESIYHSEKRIWDHFYDSIESIEQNLSQYEHIVVKIGACLKKCQVRQ